MVLERPAFTATPFLHVDGLLISSATGEIFGYDDKPSVFSERPDYKPELSKCRSADDLNAFLKHVDRRKLPEHTLHSIRNEVDHCMGEWLRTGVDYRITLPQQRLLEVLHQLVVYRNVIFMTKAALVKALGTAESNLIKKLKVLEAANMLRVTTSRNGEIRTGEIKLVINPRLVFRGGDYTRQGYVEDWYRPVGLLSSRLEYASGMGKCTSKVA